MATFGENLRRERELRGVELREMADATKISIRFLSALEQGRVDILPGGIFPRAFVRQYARYLGLDPERVVAEFVYAHGGEPVPAKKSAPVRVDQGPPPGLILLGIAAVLLALVAWKVRGQLVRTPQAAGPLVPATPATTFAHDRVYPPPSAAFASAAPVNAGALVLVVTARHSSWVEAKVDGTTLLNRVLKDGESQRLEARREVVLSASNAGGVAVTLNDRPLGPLGREGDSRRDIVINAQTAPAMLAAGASSPGPVSSPAALVPASPRAITRRRPSPPPPSPSPSSTVLLLTPRPDGGFGAGGLVPPASHPSPSPRP